MNRRIEFPVAGHPGQFVTVEVEQPAEQGLGPVSRGGIDRASDTFEAAVAKIQPIAGGIVAGVQGMVHAPDSVSIELGITFDAKSGVIISSVGVQANLKVTLAWKKQDSPGRAAEPAGEAHGR